MYQVMECVDLTIFTYLFLQQDIFVNDLNDI